MPCLNAALVILAVLCCNSQVYSDVQFSSKRYTFQNQRIVVGKDHVDETTITYALCETDPYQESARCTIRYEDNVFDETRRVRNCSADVSTVRENGKIEFLGLDRWGEDRAIFTWWDLKKSNVTRALLNVQTFDMRNCQLTEHRFKAYNRNISKPEVFIVTSENDFIVAFMNKKLCESKFCKVTINADGDVSPIESWFSNVDLAYAMQGIDNNPNKILVTLGLMKPNYGMIRYHLVTEDRINKLGEHRITDDIGWSTSNDIISFCTIEKCKLFNYDGDLFDITTLHIEHEIREFKALYNLPHAGGHLAVICDSRPNGNYRFVKIGVNGEQQFSFDLRGFSCAYKADYMTSKFFMKSNTEYCVTIFQTMYSYSSWALFRLFCFSLQDMMNNN